jgi:hypothetical protein
MKIKLSKLEWVLFVLFGIIVLFIPIILTRESSMISFTDKGEIGDTIGGTTAPFLGFFGSILVYLALKAQIEANEQVREQFKKQEIDSKVEKRIVYFKNRTDTILFEINNFYYSYIDDHQKGPSQKLNYQGSQAILKLLQNSKNTFYGQNKVLSPDLVEPKLKELESLLVFFEITILEIKNDTILTDDVKSELAKFLKFVFESKLRNIFKSLEDYKSKHEESCPDNCGNFHGIPSYLFELVDSIKIKVDSMALDEIVF